MAPGPSSWACEHPIACRGPEGYSALVPAWQPLALPARTPRHSHTRLVSALLRLVRRAKVLSGTAKHNVTVVTAAIEHRPKWPFLLPICYLNAEPILYRLLTY